MNITPRITRTVAVVAVGLAGIFAVVGGVDAKGGANGTGGGGATGGGDAPQNVYLPAGCSTPDTGFVGYNKSGDRVTFFFGAHHDTSTSGWHVTVTDAGVNLLDENVPALGTDWTMLRNYTSPKGQRTVIITANALDGSNSCLTTLSYKA